jgi:hypothetical protein
MRKITAQLNYKRIKTIDYKIAKCVLARDYKGFGTGFSYQNGVIEEWK